MSAFLYNYHHHHHSTTITTGTSKVVVVVVVVLAQFGLPTTGYELWACLW